MCFKSDFYIDYHIEVYLDSFFYNVNQIYPFSSFERLKKSVPTASIS